MQDVKFANAREFALDGCWRPVQGKTRQQFVDIPIFAAEKVGAELSFAFAGTAVGILVVAGPDAGTIEYSVDQTGEKVRFVHRVERLFTYSVGLHVRSRFGRHLLQLRVVEAKHEQSQGYAVRIVRFMVNASA